MKRQAGFTLIEVLVATAVMMIIAAAVYSALTNAIHTTEGVTLLADTQQNLRAGMNYLVHLLDRAPCDLAGLPVGVARTYSRSRDTRSDRKWSRFGHHQRHLC